MISGSGDAPVGLFETLGFDAARWRFVDEHRARMAGSAAWLGLPFDGAAFDRTLASVAVRSARPILCRVDLAPDGSMTARTRPLDAVPEPVRLVVTNVRVASADLRLRHKTLWRAPYDAALAEARARGADDGLLRNEHGRVTETSRFTLFVDRGRGPLLTPPLSDGLLAGVLRAHLLESGQSVETSLTPSDLAGAALWVGNAARGLLQAVLVEG